MAKSVELPRLRWSEETHRRLADLITRRGAKAATYDRCKRPLAVFDFDNTIIQGDLGDAAFAEAAARGLLAHDPALTALLPEAAREQVDGAWKSGAPDTAGRLLLAYEALLKDQGARVAYPWLTQAFTGTSRRTSASSPRSSSSRSRPVRWAWRPCRVRKAQFRCSGACASGPR